MLYFINPGKKPRRNPRRVSRGHRLEGGYAVPEWRAKPRSKPRTVRRVHVAMDSDWFGRDKNVRYRAVSNPRTKKAKMPKALQAIAKKVRAGQRLTRQQQATLDRAWFQTLKNPKKRGKNMAKKRRRMGSKHKRKRLYGAALAAHKRKRANRRRSTANKRRRGSRRRKMTTRRRARRVGRRTAARRVKRTKSGRFKKNPSRRRMRRNPPPQVATDAYRSSYERTFGKKRSAGKRPKKRRGASPGGRKTTSKKRRSGGATKRRPSGSAKQRRAYGAAVAGGASTSTALTLTTKQKKAWAKKYATGGRKKRKSGGKKGRRKTKKTAARRRTKGGGSMAKKKRKGKRSKASYRAAGKKAARTRARNKAARSAARRKGGRKGRRRRGGKRAFVRTGMRSLVRARRMIRRKGRKRNTRAYKYIKARRMRSNPSIRGMVDIVKRAVPVVGAFYIGRIAANKVTQIPAVGGVIGKLGIHAGPAVAAATLLGGTLLTAKVRPLAKYAGDVAMGLGVNLIFTLVDTYVPDSIKHTVGLGDAGLYDEALGEYDNTLGEYDTTLGEYQAGELSGVDDLGGGLLGPGSEESGMGGGIFSRSGWAA